MYFINYPFTFDDFESLLQNFGLPQTISKFGNFGLVRWRKMKKSISQLPTIREILVPKYVLGTTKETIRLG